MNSLKNCNLKNLSQQPKPRIINIGLASFYQALTAQEVKAVQLDWRPPVKQSQEIVSLLDDLL